MKSDPRESRKESESVEVAVADLQMRLTYQDEEIRMLNLTLDRQRSDIEALKAETARLKKLLALVAPAQADDSRDETPPHY